MIFVTDDRRHISMIVVPDDRRHISMIVVTKTYLYDCCY